MQLCKHCQREIKQPHRLQLFCDDSCRQKARYVPREKKDDKARLLQDIYIDKEDCHIWHGRAKVGAAQFSLKGVIMTVQRAAWIILKKQKIPPDHNVRHTCKGKKLCINIDHLYLKKTAKAAAKETE